VGTWAAGVVRVWRLGIYGSIWEGAVGVLVNRFAFFRVGGPPSGFARQAGSVVSSFDGFLVGVERAEHAWGRAFDADVLARSLVPRAADLAVAHDSRAAFAAVGWSSGFSRH
jgi:hypothetical protein